jgi:polyisoprenyl-phosphate glycosyltransferase
LINLSELSLPPNKKMPERVPMRVSSSTPPVIGIVIPCYNEEAVLNETHRQIHRLLEGLTEEGLVSAESCIWFVDDGSRDATWARISGFTSSPGNRSVGIRLSRNKGHQAALLAGLMTATGDALISVDADLQDDLGVIRTMIQHHLQGSEIVYGVRGSRETDTFFKRVTAEGYYRVLQRFGVEVVFNHADYRLMGRRAIEALRQCPESNIFLRGLIPQLGFRFSAVEYARAERFAGESKYPLSKMLALAWQGITSFSTAPLRTITALGVSVSLLSLSLVFWALYVRLFTEDALPGWSSIVIPVLFLSGVQLLSLGVIGEYVAKIFVETKRRPHYFIDEVVGKPDEVHLR